MPARRALGAAALVTLLATSSASSAQGADDLQAQSLFVEGRTAMEKGDYPTACSKFTASLAIVSRAGTLLNLALCEQQQNHLVSAAKHWQQGIALLPPGDDRLPVSKERAAALAKRLPHLTLQLTGTVSAGARAELDGAPARLDELQAGVPADPGRHVVVVLVPGAADQRATVDLAEGDARVVTLAIVPGPEHVTPPPPPPPSGARGGGLRTVGFALTGVGVAGFVVAGVTGGILVSKHATISADCPGMVCGKAGSPTSKESLTGGLGPLNAANAVGWALGLAGVAVGVPLIIVGGPKAPQATVGAATLPGGAGLLLTGQL